MEEGHFDEHWSAITNRMEKICEVADRLQWEELVNMIIDTFDEAVKETDGKKLFATYYQFFLRIYYRVKDKTAPEGFNIVYNDKRLVNNVEVPMFRIKNYDFKMYKWARDKGCLDTMTNDWYLIRKDSLRPAELRSFEAKAKNLE